MTAPVLTRPTPTPASVVRRPAVRSFSWSDRLFLAALGVVVIHLIFVAVTSPTAHQAAAAGLAALGLGPPMFMLYEGGGRVMRTLVAGGLGLGATAAGIVHHVPRLLLDPGHADDVTGALLAVAGLVLVGLAFHAAFRDTRRRTKLLAIPVALVLLEWFVLPVATAALATNASRPAIPDVSTLGIPGARAVSFPALDGVPLGGWYAPGRGSAAVVLMHGSHGTRADTADWMRFLSQAGYAVLAFDARGHGESGGQTNALGWHGDDDVAGAVEYVNHQPGINPERVAAVGLSMGGEEALRASADGIRLAAVVADGAGASTSGDKQLVSGDWVARSVDWVTMRAVGLFSGESEPPPLKDRVAHIHVPVLLIASNASNELAIDQAFRAKIGSEATLWHVADAGHTRALAKHPDVYRARVTGFLRHALRLSAGTWRA